MKHIFLFSFLLLLGSGCVQNDNYGDPGPSEYYALKAIVMSRDSLRNSVRSEAARDLHDPGKIYLYKNFLFVVEPGTGIHVYDNANPSNPANLSFITVPGCNDVAVKDNTLYADNAVDLVAMDISDPRSVNVSSRTENVFPELDIPADQYYYEIFSNPDPAKFITIGWKDTLIKRM